MLRALLFALVTTVAYGAADDPYGLLVNNRFALQDYSREGQRMLYVHCFFWNRSDDPDNLRHPVVIRGIQTRYGAFFPIVTLAVSRSRDGPWTPIQMSKRGGKKIEVTIPADLRVEPLKVDCMPFVSVLSTMRWAKIQLPTGDAAVFDLQELKESWEREYTGPDSLDK